MESQDEEIIGPPPPKLAKRDMMQRLRNSYTASEMFEKNKRRRDLRNLKATSAKILEARNAKRRMGRKRAELRKCGMIDLIKMNDKMIELHYFMNKRFFLDALDDYCRVCDRIWWKNGLRVLTREKNENQINFLIENGYASESLKVCSSCWQNVSKLKIPTLAKVNGFAYPPKPRDLPDLTSVEERLISPRLPFMQIRHIRYFPNAKRIVGQVINVPVNVNTMVKALPRALNDDLSFNVNLKRHLLQKGAYMSGTVVKRNLKIWLKHLIVQPLYQKHNVFINEAFFDNAHKDYEEPKIQLEYNSIDHDDHLDAWEEMEAALRKSENTFTKVTEDEREISGEELLSLHQQTLFWGENSILHMAPSMGQKPYAFSFDNDAEELSFPLIYYGHERCYKVRVTQYAQATSEIRRYDRRGVRSDHLLYVAAKILRLRVIDSMNLMFRYSKCNGQQITREQLEDFEFVKESLDRNDSFLREIPNSIQYWHNKKRDLFAMMRQLGKPTLFVTLSASEIHWKHLLRCVYKFGEGSTDQNDDNNFPDDIFDNMSNYERAAMINNDPVLCCLYFEKLVQCFLAAFKKKNGVFGKYHVKDFFRRIEFQHRGSPHCHMLLWLDNAPSCDNTAENDHNIIQLINELATVDGTKLNNDRPVQTHHHTQTCYKKSKRRCRFGAPFWPMLETRILYSIPKEDRDESLVLRYFTLHENLDESKEETIEDFLRNNMIECEGEYLTIIRHGITRTRIFLKRGMKDIWTNPFNEAIASVLNSNMDIQYILDEYSCAAYVAEYINKSDRGYSSLHRELIRLRDEFPEMDYHTCMKELGKQVLNGIEMCAQEAAWFLLRMPMCQMSRSTLYIPTQHPSERPLIRKTNSEMKAEGISLCSVDVWKKNIVQRYEKRPQNLEIVCLADFVAKYTTRYTTPKESLPREGEDDNEEPIIITSIEYIPRKRHDAIIRWRNYKCGQDVMNYKRECVTLFYPFRSEELDILNNDAYFDIYKTNAELLEMKRKYYDSGISMERVEEIILAAQNDERTLEETEGDERGGPLFRTLHDETCDLTGKPFITNNNDDIALVSRTGIARTTSEHMPHIDFCKMIRNCNTNQKKIVLTFLVQLWDNDLPPLEFFFTGPAGSGKSFVLKIFMEIANRFSQNRSSKNNAYIACATTGKAAVSIGGTTVHSAFHIGINNSRRLPLSGDKLQTMRFEFSNINTIVIDEVSMMSSDLLCMVTDRLRNIGCDYRYTFGGFNVVFCGDLRQLPPVNARSVFIRPPNMLQDKMIWQNWDYFSLSEIVRQSDKKFSDALTVLGTGSETLTEQQLEMFESRFVEREESTKLAGVRLYFSNKDVDNYNFNLLARNHNEVVVADDQIQGEQTLQRINSIKTMLRSLNIARSGNMPHRLYLEIGRPYMITQNIDIPDGIVNGVVGLLRYVEHESQSISTVKRLWLEFDTQNIGIKRKLKYSNVAYRNSISRNFVPIMKREGLINVDRTTKVRRKQFPLVAANAMTIHKSQGATFDNVIYDYSKSHDTSLCYVALSRSKTLEGLTLTNSNNDYKFYHGRKKGARPQLEAEIIRLEKNKRMKTICDQAIEFTTTSLIPPIGSLNVQSLQAHFEDVETDPVYKYLHYLVLSETWNHNNQDSISINNFECLARKNSSPGAAGGIAIYKNILHTENQFCVYAKPNIKREDLINALSLCLEKFTNTYSNSQYISMPLVICGDFNYNIGEDTRLVEFLNQRNINVVSQAKATTFSGSKIDWVLYRFKKVLRMTGVPKNMLLGGSKPPPAKMSKRDKTPKKSIVLENDESDDAAPAPQKLDENEYMLAPSTSSNSFCSQQKLDEYFKSMRGTDTEMIIVDNISELKEAKLKFNKLPTTKQHFTQYNYKKPLFVMVATNAYGFFIGDCENFGNRITIHNLSALRIKHRVSLLLPTVTHWWHVKSKDLMIEAVNRIVGDLKVLAGTVALREAFTRRGIVDPGKMFVDMRHKILTSTKVTNEKLLPGIFNLRIPLGHGIPATISAAFAIINADQTLTESSAKTFMPCKYVQSVIVIKISGVKITPSGLSIDMELVNIAFKNLERIDKSVPVRRIYSSLVKPRVEEDESDEEEGEQSGEPLDVSTW